MEHIPVRKNEDLSSYTTVKIGGIAKNMFFPTCENELRYLIRKYPDARILGGGSNLLIADKSFDVVINMKNYDTRIISSGDGQYQVGSSVRNQLLINNINESGYGGIEYLFSVPGLLGGAIVMNAGSGVVQNQCISDFISSVTVMDRQGEVSTFSKKECQFSHRQSLFLKTQAYIILYADFIFTPIDKDEARKRREDRISFCKKTQDNSAPNFGSVFKYANYRILRMAQILGLGNGKGVHFSKKSANWLLNSGDKHGYESAMRLIRQVEILHKILGKKCEVEVIIWS